MLNIYGAAIQHLPSAEEMLGAMPPEWGMAWKARHPRLSRPQPMRESLGGLWLLSHAGMFGKLSYTAGGRPFFEDICADFSITHTKNHVFCAVLTDAKGDRIGLDAEPLERADTWNFTALAARWFSSSEREAFEAEPTAERFLSIWTRKEAAVKQSGKGFSALADTDTVMLEKSGKLSFFAYRVQNNVLTVAFPPHLSPPAQIEYRS